MRLPPHPHMSHSSPSGVVAACSVLPPDTLVCLPCFWCTVSPRLSSRSKSVISWKSSCKNFLVKLPEKKKKTVYSVYWIQACLSMRYSGSLPHSPLSQIVLCFHPKKCLYTDPLPCNVRRSQRYSIEPHLPRKQEQQIHNCSL